MASEDTPTMTALPPPSPLNLVEELGAESTATAPVVDQAGAGEHGLGRLAEVAIMPPPIAGDPWSPVVEASLTGGSSGGGDDGAA
jgi:hypothetical protein